VFENIIIMLCFYSITTDYNILRHLRIYKWWRNKASWTNQSK